MYGYAVLVLSLVAAIVGVLGRTRDDTGSLTRLGRTAIVLAVIGFSLGCWKLRATALRQARFDSWVATELQACLHLHVNRYYQLLVRFDGPRMRDALGGPRIEKGRANAFKSTTARVPLKSLREAGFLTFLGGFDARQSAHDQFGRSVPWAELIANDFKEGRRRLGELIKNSGDGLNLSLRTKLSELSSDDYVTATIRRPEVLARSLHADRPASVLSPWPAPKTRRACEAMHIVTVCGLA